MRNLFFYEIISLFANFWLWNIDWATFEISDFLLKFLASCQIYWELIAFFKVVCVSPYLFGKNPDRIFIFSFDIFQFRINGTSYTVWDVGGQDKLQPLWRSYTCCTDGIIFVIDSTKEDRMEEAKLEWLNLAFIVLSYFVESITKIISSVHWV